MSAAIATTIGPMPATDMPQLKLPPAEPAPQEQPPKAQGNPKFRAVYGLEAARMILLNGSRGVKFGGGTERVGKLARQVLGAKFGSYRPSDAMEALRKGDFDGKFREALEQWRTGWDPAVADNTQKMRENQYKAATNFLADGGFNKIADAIESMLANRSHEVNLEDTAGNVRQQSLIDACDLFLGIKMTASRAASLKVR